MVWWLPAAAWAVVYTSDMLFTLAGYALYRRLQGRFVRFDTYELTPFWKTTIERGHPFSLRFGLALLTSSAVVLVLGWLFASIRSESEVPFEVALGGLFLMEVIVHLRHVRNVVLFRALLGGNSGAEGTLRYPAPLTYRMSAMEFLAFSAFYGLVAAGTFSWFWLGGAVVALVVAVQHTALGRAASRQSAITTGNLNVTR
jgi:hypothetical protein